MATYLKRTSKLFDFSLSRASGDVSLRDLLCPVCRGILIEPVTLPCTHNLCLRCLKGTFEHNSLSCPLCRVRVGSWLRTATKSETLVNSGLWEFIQAKFPKEVEDKYNGDDGDIDLDAGYTAANKILSAAGEIRREYEAQLQMVEEERRCQREAEQMASEALIRKIQAEEQQQQLAQLAQDQLFAKALAKKQATEKHNEASKTHGRYPNTSLSYCSMQNIKYNVNAQLDVDTSKIGNQETDSGKVNLLEFRDSSELRRPNIALISKIRAERYASSMKVHTNHIQKVSSVKLCCQKPMPVYNPITRTLKQQPIAKIVQPCTSSYSVEPGSSGSKIYGSQCKEELHVPSDVVNSKKKSLGVEVCVTSGEDDERIGSAESAASHDSINQEIHHFKPIKAMPRTPLKTSPDGRQIDPKLIRVVPLLKRISNAVPKPPSQTHVKRVIGCSWSAFRGKSRQHFKEQDASQREERVDICQRASTSYDQIEVVNNSCTKGQDDNRRLHFVPEIIYDSNKNYTKSEGHIVNGVHMVEDIKVEEHIDKPSHKSWKTHTRNGIIGKARGQRNARLNKKEERMSADEEDNEDSMRDSASQGSPVKMHAQGSMQTDATVENIAERIKRRKVNVNKNNAHDDANRIVVESEVRRKTKKRGYKKMEINNTSEQQEMDLENQESQSKTKGTSLPKSKRRRIYRRTKDNTEDLVDDFDTCKNVNGKFANPGVRKSTRNTKHSSRNVEVEDPSTDDQIDEEDMSPTGRSNISDIDIIKEQERIERLVLQEKEDFELAQRLQAKFDEMSRIAGRTRQSRKAIDSTSFEIDLNKLNTGTNVQKTTSVSTAKRQIINQTVNSEPKKRGRPPKRIK